MNILRTAAKEIIGMFIDDGALALLSLVLVLAIGAAAQLKMIDGALGAILLLVGCVLILAESVMRAARTWTRKR
jgi:hypothetical protein